MNIKEAKQQIKNAVIAYQTKDAFGKNIIPISKQRPIFLIGAPGIGKTAIMEQIASELDLAIVSYSMTHHTRQSALGLPFIVEKTYGENNYQVSEYTMSEIIASIYDEMEATGKKNGILFLDEINCISETLAPSMLQFLQYKTFGRHQVPEGWVIVTAGNPSEYNNSVKEFDIAMWDRLKKIEVEADFDTWKEFAINASVHPVVTSYLSIKPSHFYTISTTVDGKSFVTARGWDDLSQMISLYEMNNLQVDYNLVSQYLQDEKIAKDFSHYYQLFHKYESDYKVDTILLGNCDDEIKQRAKNAKFDERLSLISLIISQLDETIALTCEHEEALKQLMACFKQINAKTNQYDEYLALMNENKLALFEQIKHLEANHQLSKHQETYLHRAIDLMSEMYQDLSSQQVTNPKAFIKEALSKQLEALKESNTTSQQALDNTFTFFEEVYGDGQEMLILVTEMTINQLISQYIYSHDCPKYYKHNRQLLFSDKQNELLDKIDQINLLEFEE